MNKIDLLKTRRAKLLEAGKDIRADISALTDDGSFVELDAYAFSHSDFYNEDAQGEGVVTGYATINDVPVYVVAQNVNVLSGGVSKANCAKIKKCLDKALAGGKPVKFRHHNIHYNNVEVLVTAKLKGLKSVGSFTYLIAFKFGIFFNKVTNAKFIVNNKYTAHQTTLPSIVKRMISYNYHNITECANCDDNAHKTSQFREQRVNNGLFMRFRTG